MQSLQVPVYVHTIKGDQPMVSAFRNISFEWLSIGELSNIQDGTSLPTGVCVRPVQDARWHSHFTPMLAR